MKKAFILRSADGWTGLRGYIWKTETAPKAVLVLVHGMVEHISRYAEFAEYLQERGIAVVGYDLLGHGDSVITDEDLGYFGGKHGLSNLLKDIHNMVRTAKHEYPDTPVFVLGHSMGSFLVRRYITLWGDEVDGAVVMGTGSQPLAAAETGRILANVVCRIFGERHRSKLLNFLAVGTADLQFRLQKKGSWLSKNDASVQAYAEDPKCGFIFTASAFHTLFSVIGQLAKKCDFEKIPKELPLFFVSGMEDPIGAASKGVLQAYNEMVTLGMTDLNIKLYQNDRHEILQELDREVVFADIEHWIREKI